MDGLPVLQEHLSRWLSGASEGDSSRHTRDQTNVDHPFGGSPESENEALNGLVASGVAGLVYFVLAMLCITSISAICRCSTWTLERCGCRCGQSAYLIELSLLLQNNWYYVLGYSWEMFWSYFGSRPAGIGAVLLRRRRRARPAAGVVAVRVQPGARVPLHRHLLRRRAALPPSESATRTRLHGRPRPRAPLFCAAPPCSSSWPSRTSRRAS